jgi:hypothetical protein
LPEPTRLGIRKMLAQQQRPENSEKNEVKQQKFFHRRSLLLMNGELRLISELTKPFFYGVHLSKSWRNLSKFNNNKIMFQTQENFYFFLFQQ